MGAIQRFACAVLLISLCAVAVQGQTMAGGSITANGQSITAGWGNAPLVGASIQITGTWTGTITFQATVDGTNYVTLLASNVTTGATASSTTANGAWGVSNSGYRSIRATATAAMTGTAVVTINQGYSSGGGAGAAGSVTQGTDPWIVGDGAGALNVICDSGCSGGTQYAEDAVHASGNTGTLGLAVRSDAGAALAADGDNIPLMVNGVGSLFTAATSVVPGTGATNLGKAEDAAHTSADTAVAIVGVRSDTTPASTAGTAGDYALPNLDANGRMYVNATLYNAAGAAVSVATDSTHDSAASSTGPQVMGSGKNTTLPTAVTDGDAVRLLTDLYGRLQPKNVCENPELVTSVVISTASSGNVELVPISGSTVVTVCGFNVVATGTVAVQMISGTGTACATGETNKTGAMPFVANGGINTGFGSKIFSGAAGEAVCIELSAAIQVDGVLSYVQQ